MSPADVLRSAVRGLLANKLRSALTMLGVLIGVGSVIVLIAIGNGSAQQVRQSIEQLGTNTLRVMPDNGDNTSVRDQDLTLDVARALGDDTLAPDVRSVTPGAVSSQTLSTADASYDAQVVGTSPSYFQATNSPVAAGRAFTAEDQDARRRVVVLGDTVAGQLFGAANPIGEHVTMNGVPFLVTGVLKDKGSAGFSDSGDTVVAPLSAVRDVLTGYGALDQVVVQATSSSTVDLAEAEISQLLNQQLHVTDPADPPYRILNQSQLQRTLESATTTFTVLLAAIAAISLLVGGIGITNIMLVTVTERTREIGIRKALGAQRGAILGQFLAEAALMSLLGGAFGVAAGLLASRFTIAGTQPAVVPLSIPLALGVSLLIGVFFGGYPANRAGRLQPIDALRYE